MQTIITDPITADAASPAALSRGWQLGDAHFSTLHARAGRLCHWPYHQARLANACSRLQMPAPDWNRLYADAQAALDGSDQVLRITLIRGPGARGYGIAGCGNTTVVLNSSPFPAHYYQWREQGIAIGVCTGRLGLSPLLAGLKTVNRLEQVLLKAELEANGWPEGVVLDGEGRVMEAVTANLFWREGDRVCTPDLSSGGVCGTLRAWCLDYLGTGLAMVDADLPRLLAADEVWLTNALMGVVPVTAIGERCFASDFNMARELQRAYEEKD
ncbi:aminodeoxychorismate lyase [Oceanisphaera psychrotolerans]|uniref:Aminodeoxychorismate lyase n=1 Tax=Oceanisphaera psychrotolerans TaxID=1414654 RepID=A0A1J4Q9D3_9GAMM|nr:aminodeoxychorismate lyase [Oceanisphaera psychrotolerans]OIN04352.1 aminodeoxychorismate lyase [Oceanisphaera psychrotolerans]